MATDSPPRLVRASVPHGWPLFKLVPLNVEVAGPLLGGWFTEGPGWRWAFLINIPLGILAIVATALLLRLPPKNNLVRPKVDYLGMATLGLATTAIVLIATWGGSTFDWNSPTIIGLIIGAVLFAGIFILVETRVSEPVMPLALFRDRNFNLTTVAALLTSIAMFGAIGYMPPIFRWPPARPPPRLGS